MRSVSVWKYSIATVALMWGIGGHLVPQAQAIPFCVAASPGPFVCCGATILVSEQLLGNLFCPANDGHSPTLTVDGVTLDLNGHTVTCHTTGDNGIELIGSGATLTSGAANNGVVTNCFDGVILAGSGTHSVSKVTSQKNADDGFEVDTDKNVLDNNTSFKNAFGFFITGRRNLLTNNDNVSFNDFDGFLVVNNKNRLVDNTADDNGDDGFDIEAIKTFLTSNTSTFNGDNGFIINGDNNKLTDNTAEHNGSDENENDGFHVSGFKNKLINNQANFNIDSGFEFDSSANNATVSGNTATYNVTGFLVEAGSGSHNFVRNTASNNSADGFLIGGNSNVLKLNTANNNGDDGIEVGGSSNGIRQNQATSNSDHDLHDDNLPDCDGNQWNHNTFGTANISPPVSANCIN